MKTDDLMSPPQETSEAADDVAVPIEDVEMPPEAPHDRQDALRWEAGRLQDFKKDHVKRNNQTPCPACATYVSINANKCPHCSSDIAANNALVRESLRRLEEITAELETMREEHMERFRDAPRPPLSERFRTFLSDPQTREDSKIVVPSLLLIFAGLTVLRLMGYQAIFWAVAIVGGVFAYTLFSKLGIKRFVTIDLYRSVLVFGLLAVMASAATQPSSWWVGTGTNAVQVLGSTINIRAAHTTQSAVLATAHKGDRLKVIERRNQWYNVQTRDGQVGWVHASLVE